MSWCKELSAAQRTNAGLAGEVCAIGTHDDHGVPQDKCSHLTVHGVPSSRASLAPILIKSGTAAAPALSAAATNSEGDRPRARVGGDGEARASGGNRGGKPAMGVFLIRSFARCAALFGDSGASSLRPSASAPAAALPSPRYSRRLRVRGSAAC
jgi:hypothetical protein